MLEQLLRESAGLRLLSAQSEVGQAHFEESTSERRRQSGPLSLDLGGQIGAEFEAFGLAPITYARTTRSDRGYRSSSKT